MTKKPDCSILDKLLEGCQIIDPSFHYVYVNETTARQGGKTRKELLGHTMMEMYPGIENTPVFYALKGCMKDRKPIEMENEFTNPDGKTGWYILRLEPVPEGVFIFSIDITERKKAETDLQKQLERLEALREIDIAIASTSNLGFTLRTILFQVTNSLKVDAADVLLLNSRSMMLEFKAGRGFQTRSIENSEFPLGKGNAGRAAISQRAIFLPDLSNNKEATFRSSLVKDEQFVSYCAEPLISKGKLVGVMEVFHRSPLKPDQSWFDFLTALGGQASIAIDCGQLFQDLQNLTKELILGYDATIESWSRALDLRDKENEGHTLRVTDMTMKLAKMAGMIDEEIIHVKRGALLHDIGKMGVPDSILMKSESLTAAEWEIIRKHPTFAHDFINPIEYLRPALPIPSFHHEKWDGSGYPLGLKGDQIPLSARLFAVADVWDALTHDRPYRKGWSEEKVLDYIKKETKIHFDPSAVNFFISAINQKPIN